MNKAIKRNSGERKKFVGVLCLFDFGRILKDFFKRVKTALRCRVRFSRYVLWLWAKWIKITLFFLAIGPAARRQGGSAVFWISHSGVLSETQFKNTIWFYHIYKKIARKKQWIFKNNLKIFDFCKKFSPKNQKETSVGQILSVLSDEISKWRNLSDYRTMRYLFFCTYGVFPARRFFTRARTCMWAYARPHTPVQRMRIYYRREKNGISAVGVLWLFCGTFHPASSKKAKLRNFRGKTVRNHTKFR